MPIGITGNITKSQLNQKLGTGYIRQLIIYSAVPTGADLSNLEAYLAAYV